MNRTEASEILLATSNEGKRREFLQLLPPGITVRTLSDLRLESAPETGTTFVENADIKAIAASLGSGMLALADDSGLEVVALAGQPGVFSARFAGEPASDERNRAKLLEVLRTVPEADRSARFVCAVSLARHGDVIARAEGVCPGTITIAPRDTLGFGYDPLFQLQSGRTMAELDPAEKNSISHRAHAYRELLPALLAAVNSHVNSGAF